MLAVQRAITIREIDFNPLGAGHFVHATANQGGFYAAFRAAVQANANLRLYRNQLANVVNTLNGHGFEGRDVEVVTESIVTATQRAYEANQVTAWPGGVQESFTNIVRTALIDNLPPTAMNRPESEAFDVLVNTVGSGAVSRRKGYPTTIAHGALPAPLAAEVRGIRNLLSREHRRWHKATFPYEAMTVGPLTASIAGRLQGGQPLQDAQRQINRDRALKTEYYNHLAVAAAAYTDEQMRDMAWAALGNDVSVYIEFWLATPISRFVFDSSTSAST